MKNILKSNPQPLEVPTGPPSEATDLADRHDLALAYYQDELAEIKESAEAQSARQRTRIRLAEDELDKLNVVLDRVKLGLN